MSVLGLSLPSVVKPTRPAAGYGAPNGLAGILGQEYTDLNNGNVYIKTGISRDVGWIPVGTATGNATVLYGTSGQIAPIGVTVQAGPAVWYGTDGSIWFKTDPGNDFLNWYPLLTATERQIYITNGDPLLPTIIIGGVNYGGQEYHLSVSALGNGQGQRLDWTFPGIFVDGVTLVPGTGPDSGTTHWPVFSLTLQRSPSSTNTPAVSNFPFTVSTNQSTARTTLTSPDWVNIAQWSNTTVDLLPKTYIDPALPNPTWNYRLIMQLGKFTAGGFDAVAELDWNVASISNAAHGQINWLNTILGNISSSSAIAYAVAADSHGNVYVGGTFSGTVNFPGAKGSTSSTQGTLDAFLIKYNYLGVFQWVNTFGSTSDDSIYALCIDSADNVIVTGGFHRTVDVGGGTTLVATGNTYYDIFVVKYDPNGIVVWAQSYGGSFDDIGSAIAVDSSNNVILAGRFQSQPATFGAFTFNAYGNTGSFDIVVAKLSGVDGTVTWAQQWGGTSDDIPTGIAVSGNFVYVVGQFWGVSTFGSGSFYTSNGAADIFIAKYSLNNGSWVWDTVYGTPNQDNITSICVDPTTGNIVVGGNFVGHMNLGGGLRNSGSNGTATSLFLASYTPAGSLVWDLIRGGDIPGSQDKVVGVAFDTFGNLAVTGFFSSWMDFNRDGQEDAPGSGYFTAVMKVGPGYVPTPPQSTANTGTGLVTSVWSNRSQVSGSGLGNGVCFDVLGNVIACGTWTGSFNVGTGHSASTPGQGEFAISYVK